MKRDNIVTKSRINWTFIAALVSLFSFMLIGCGTSLGILIAPEQENPDFQFVQTYSATPNAVYSKLLQVIERNDRKILKVDAAELTILFDWPISLLHNRNPGKALIKCEANEKGTVVSIGGYSERATWALRLGVAKQVFSDLSNSLSP